MPRDGGIVVYTAIFGGWDVYVEPPEGDYRTVLFTDDCCGTVVKRAHVVVVKGAGDPVRAARGFKINPMTYLGSATYSLWVDGSITMRNVDVNRLIEENLRDADIALFAHPCRNCLYEEAQACVDLRKDDPNVIQRQVMKYQSEGCPKGSGLVETGVLLRRHSVKVAEFSRRWWREVMEFSRRDQISFPYVVWKTGVKYNIIPGTMGSRGFIVRKHKHDQ